MTILPYQDGRLIRFVSDRTGETLFEIKMLDGALLVWGARYRRLRQADPASVDVADPCA